MSHNEQRRQMFLASVVSYVESDPEVAPHIFKHVEAGISYALEMARKGMCDMERALFALASKKFNGSEQFMIDILKEHNGKAHLKWDWLIEELTNKINKNKGE